MLNHFYKKSIFFLFEDAKLRARAKSFESKICTIFERKFKFCGRNKQKIANTMSDDWDTVTILKKKPLKAAQMKTESAINLARE